MNQTAVNTSIGDNKHKPINLSINLNQLMKARHVTISQISQDLDIPTMTIRRLLSGETEDPRISTIKMVADYFKISVIDLIEGDPKNFLNALNRTKPHLVPILNWETAEKIMTINELDLINWKEWQPISLNEQYDIGKNVFALESKPFMYPRFPQGTVFIIDPDTSASDGDIVLVKIKKNNELTLRELMVDSPEWKLHPIVPGSSNAIQYNAREYEIIGVNLITMLFNRRLYS